MNNYNTYNIYNIDIYYGNNINSIHCYKGYSICENDLDHIVNNMTDIINTNYKTKINHF